MDIYNIDWGYIMDIAIATIIGALIAVAGSITVNWLGNRKGYKDIDKKIGKLDNTTLSGQHGKITDDIKKSIDENSKELNNKIDNKIGTLDNTTLSGQNTYIIKRIDDINSFLNDEKKQSFEKMQMLNGDMSKINSSIEALSNFSELMKKMSYDNNQLNCENKQLKLENQELLKTISDLQAELNQTQAPANSFTQSM